MIEPAEWPEEVGPRLGIGIRLAEAAIAAAGGTVRVKLSGTHPENISTVARQRARNRGFRLQTSQQDDGYLYARIVR